MLAFFLSVALLPGQAVAWRFHDDDAGVGAADEAQTLEEKEGSGSAVLRLMPEALPPEMVRHVLDSLSFHHFVAICSESRSVTVWGPGGPQRILRGHTAEITGVLFFPLGDMVLTWGRDATAIVWSAATGEALQVLRHDAPVECARLFPASDRVVTTTEDGTSVVWEVASGEALAVLRTGLGAGDRVVMHDMLRGVEVFPDGLGVLTWGLERLATVWDATTGEPVCKLRGHDRDIDVAKIFPDGGKILTGSFDHTAIIWSTASCSMLRRLEHSHWVMGVAILHGGEVVATTTSTGRVTTWSVSAGEVLRTLAWPTTRVVRIVIGLVPFPKDDRLVTFNLGMATIWNATSGEELHRLSNAPDRTHGAAVSLGGDLVATCGIRQVTVWDARSGAKLHALELPLSARPATEVPESCAVAIGPGSAFDPRGFGPGASWWDLFARPEASLAA